MFERQRNLPDNIPLSFIPEMEKIVMQYYNLTYSGFLKHMSSRKMDYVWARYILMYLQIRHTKQSLATIGQRYSKDHATVLHARKTIENFCETDKYRYKDVNLIYHQIYNAYKVFGNELYFCIKCGSDKNISISLQIDPNTNIILEELPENSPGICKKCGETTIVTKTEYKIYYS